jgi:hypothetical protein
MMRHDAEAMRRAGRVDIWDTPGKLIPCCDDSYKFGLPTLLQIPYHLSGRKDQHDDPASGLEDEKDVDVARGNVCKEVGSVNAVGLERHIMAYCSTLDSSSSLGSLPHDDDASSLVRDSTTTSIRGAGAEPSSMRLGKLIFNLRS